MTVIRLRRFVRRSTVLAAFSLAAALTSASSAQSATVAPVLHVTTTSSTATLTWKFPGYSVAGYVVLRSTNGTKFATVARIIRGTSYVATGVHEGKTYEFIVLAEERSGSVSPPSNIVVVTPTGPPTSPRRVYISGEPSAAKVTWYAPASDGGSVITRYVVTSMPKSRGCAEVATPLNLGAKIPGPVQSCVVRGLRDGVHYRFRVVALNRRGASAPTAWSVATPGEVPHTPTSVTAQPLDTSALVSWSPALARPRASSYRVSALPGGATCTTTTTSCTVNGLSDGVAYTFSVVAIDAIGTSTPSVPTAAVVPGAATTTTIGPYVAGTTGLSADVLTQVQALASSIEFAGSTYVRLVGSGANKADGLAIAQLTATQLASDLGGLGVTGVTITTGGMSTSPSSSTPSVTATAS